MKLMWVYLLSSMLLLGCQARSYTPDITAFESDIDTVYRKSFDDTFFGNLNQSYKDVLKLHFPNGKILALAQMSDEDLSKAQSSLFNFLLKTNNSAGEDLLEKVYKELETRDILEEKGLISRHRLYVAQRRFEDARHLQTRFPDIGFYPIPEIQNLVHYKDGDFSVLTPVSAEILSRVPLNVSNKTGVIMVGSPGCFFSRFAVDHISEDKSLNLKFEKHSLGLMGSWDVLSNPSVVEFNTGGSPVKLSFIWSESEWPQINYWGTPAFYFLKDGKIVYRHTGWRKDDREQNLEKMRTGFELIGLN